MPEPAAPDGAPVLLDLLLRAAAACGLGASALLLVEYTSPAQRFCSAGQGCDSVRLYAFAHLGGWAIPVLGSCFFLLALALSLASARRALALLGVAGGLGAAAFIALMKLVVHAWCIYCLMTDGASLAVAALAILLVRAPPARRGAGVWAASGLIAALCFALPFGIGLAHRPLAEQGGGGGQGGSHVISNTLGSRVLFFRLSPIHVRPGPGLGPQHTHRFGLRVI